MQSWLSYWEAPNKSCVSERHKQAHYDLIFDSITPYLPAGPDRVVLDWGCGDALAAERMASVSGRVLLYDAAISTGDRLRQRYGDHPRIQILDNSGVNGLPADAVDLVTVNSVIQYLAPQEFGDGLALFYRVLKPGGKLLLGDVIAPETSTSTHVTTFLRFAFNRGFLLSAIKGLAVTFMSPYRRLQRHIGLAAYTPAQLIEQLERHGFVAEKLRSNIAVSRHRSSYLARKPAKPKREEMGGECR